MTTPGLPLQERLLKWVEYEANTGCWLWSGAGLSTGYGSINVGGKMNLAHRISYRLFNGALAAEQLVCHKCDTPACINPAHLFVGSHRDNCQDMIRKGRGGWVGQKGEKNGRAKLTREQAVAIRRAVSCGERPIDLARKYGVTTGVIQHIKNGRAWK